MNKNIQMFGRTVLSMSLIAIASASHAEMTMEQRVESLQQQVNQLQALIKQQQSATPDIQPQHQPLNAANVPPPSPPAPPKEWNKLTTKNGAEFELYGNIRGDASYQSKGPTTMYNSISTVPLEGSVAEKHNSNKFQSTLNATRIGFNFKTPKLGEHNLGGKVEMDFFGTAGRDTFRIRHAYVTYDKWLLGQTWSNYNAVEYYPETVDASLSVGGSLTRVAQVKYSHPIDQNISTSVSLEDPKAETNTTAGTQNFQTDPNAKLKLPSLTGRVNYKFDNGSAVSARAFLTEKSTTYGKGDEFLAWGVAAGGKIQIMPKTLLRLDYNHIKGDTKNVLWSNYAYVFDNNQKIHANEYDAITLGVTQQFTPKIRGTLGFGYMQANDNNQFAELVRSSSSDISNLQNKQLAEGWINMFYNPYKPLNLGVEYMYGERKTFNNKTGEDNRVNFTAIYDF